MRLPLLALLFAASACTSSDGRRDASSSRIEGRSVDADAIALSEESLESIALIGAMRRLASVPHARWGAEQEAALGALVESGDRRVAWVLSDLLRVVDRRDEWLQVRKAAYELLDAPKLGGWLSITNHLMREDIAAPPDYLAIKRAIYTCVEPGWKPLFVEGAVDWRFVSWGGVLIDDREYDETDQACSCIPAVDNPGVQSVADASWLAEDDVVFGIVVGGQARAYPRRIMEVREMVNDYLGGRRLGIPYCTLCASAQAFFTDVDGPGGPPLVLRTSGLLMRSNKLMYELRSMSVFDTFRGVALTGPLQRRGVKLEQTSVVTTSWGAWRRAHPQSTVLVESLALGRDFDFRNGRDANGPIFPIGVVDARLPAQVDVFGVVTPAIPPIAFAVDAARSRLRAGKEVAARGVQLWLDGDGLRATATDGHEVAGHQSFWFAWSQVYPETKLWVR